MKSVKRFAIFFLCAILLCCTFVSAVDYSSYVAISTKEDLNSIRNNLKGSYYLTQDIIFTESDFQPGGAFYNEGSGWLPVGTSSSAFTGIFDGNGHKISGIKIDVNSTGTVYGGLFGYNQGTIKNLSVTDVDINVTGARYAYVGALCGTCSKGNISNCLVSGTINCTDGTISATVGGVVGGIYSGSISGCSSDVDITVTGSKVTGGGIAGTTYVCVDYCENLGSVSSMGRSDAYSGGIVGSGKEITNCHNMGLVSANSKCDSYAGGIAGSAENISGCYNAGMCDAIANTYMYCGSVVGSLSGTMVDCYYLSGTAEDPCGSATKSAVCVALSECGNADSFKELNLEQTWVMDDGTLRLRGMEDSFGNDVRLVSFTDNGGKLFAVRYFPSGEAPDEAALPQLPDRTGYSTIGWSGEINIEINGNISIAPIYEKDDAYIYNVVASNGTVQRPNGQGNLFFEDRVTVSAAQEGFSYWTMDGTVVSDSPVYSFLTMGNAELTAVYGQPAPTPQVFLENDAIVTRTGTDSYKFSMVGCSFIPEGYTFKEAGILLAEGQHGGQNEDFVIGSSAFTVVKRKVNAAYKNSQFMITVKNVFNGNYRSGRAYMIFVDENGVEQTVYSNDISVASY